MKNIAFFNSLKFWGGGEKLHLENAIKFENINYNVYLMCYLNSPLWKKATDVKIKTFSISVGNLSFLNPVKIIRLIWFYRSMDIDTVVFSASQDLKLGSIAAYIAGVKRIVYLRGLATPVKNKLLNRIIFKHFLTHIIPSTNATKKSMLQFIGDHVKEEKIRTIYHGININKISINNPTLKLKVIEEKGRGVILGNAGRLDKQKGQEDLIKLAHILHQQKIEFTLFIAGTGELRTELELLIEKYKLEDRVILLGFVEDMDKFMDSIDIFLLSSIREGFGFVLVEAMAKSKPIVCYDITSPGIVENNKSGFLVPYQDIELFAEKTAQLIGDDTLRKAMGQKGLERVEDVFVLEDKIREIELFLQTDPIKNKTI